MQPRALICTVTDMYSYSSVNAMKHAGGMKRSLFLIARCHLNFQPIPQNKLCLNGFDLFRRSCSPAVFSSSGQRGMASFRIDLIPSRVPQPCSPVVFPSCVPQPCYCPTLFPSCVVQLVPTLISNYFPTVFPNRFSKLILGSTSV